MNLQILIGKNRKLSAGMIAVFCFSCFIFSSCYKAYSPNDAAQFIATWSGNSSNNPSNSQTFTFTAGANAVKANCSTSIGQGVCSQVISLSGEANGNTINFPSVSVTDACGNNYIMSLTGSLFENVLTINEVLNEYITVTGPHPGDSVISISNNSFACSKVP